MTYRHNQDQPRYWIYFALSSYARFFFSRIKKKYLKPHLKLITDTDFPDFVVMYFGLMPKAMLTSTLFPVRYPLPLLKQN